jgi:uncharacterized protein (TIGR03663 family)
MTEMNHVIPRSIDTFAPEGRRTRLLGIVFPVTLETVLISMLFLAAVVTRLWALGGRVMSHDESLHVYYSWQLASGAGFAHNPMMHGPFLFEATALMNVLFGASDFTSRLVPAFLGSFIAIGIPQMLKRWLGRGGALVASGLLVISPYVLYYSRYIRHDIQVIAWTLLAVAAIFQYLQDRRTRDLILLAAALALMFSTMEITFIYLAIFALFLSVRMVLLRGMRWRTIVPSAEFDLLVVMASLGAFFSSPFALLVLNPLWVRFTGVPFVDLQVLDTQGLEWSMGQTGPRLWALFTVFALGSSAVGLWWSGRRWLKLVALFGGITVTLFTTFFTNPAGLATGFIGSLGYWLAQQEVARGTQPWYYYLIVFPLYEYLPLAGGLLATTYFFWKRKYLSPYSRLFVPFLIWWAALILLALSLAGEKMPWLSTHIAIPFILLAGWWVGQMLGGKSENSRAEQRWHVRPRLTGLRQTSRWAILGAMGALILLTLRTTIMVNYRNSDYPTELIDYAHGAPGVKWVMEDIEAIANHTSAGRDLKIAYDDEVSWPMAWYLRDFPNRAFFGEQPDRQSLDATVVIAGAKNWSKVERFLSSRYHRFEVVRLWWPLEDYKDLTWERIRFALADPGMRAALWEILWARDYTRYAKLTGKEINPPATWPLSDSMRVYVRKDIASEMLALSLGPNMLEDVMLEDPYQSARRSFSASQVISSAGLNGPRGIAVAPDGSIYVADTGNSRIVKFDHQGNYVSEWGARSPEGRAPAAPGSFTEPWGVAVDSRGNVYVADTWNHRVQKFSPDGDFLLEWGKAGQSTEDSANLWGPRGIAAGPDGRVYLTDSGNKRVVVYDQNGKWLNEFGLEGPGKLDEPVGIAVGPRGLIFVADTWNQRVVVFTSQGEFLRDWPIQGWFGDSLDNKPYLSVDNQDRVYVTDPEGFQVIVFSSDGEVLTVFGQFGPEEDAFGMPAGIAGGSDINRGIWVADAGNNRLTRFELWQQ